MKIPKKIAAFIHCKACLDELPDGESPQSYARFEVGWTREGFIQIWCLRHDKQVVTLEPSPGNSVPVSGENYEAKEPVTRH